MKRTTIEFEKTPDTASSRKQLFLVDDHTLFREGVTRVLGEQEDFCVCGEAANARDVLNRLASLQVDLVLLDISLPGSDGLELIKSLRAHHPNLLILVLSMYAEELYAERVLRAGAKGYIAKNASRQELISAVRTVLNGGIYLSGSSSKRLLQSFVGGKTGVKKGIEQLSDRELEIFRHLGDGFTTGEIAQALKISVKTVESHRGNIRQKLKLNTGAELLRLAIASKSDSGRQPA